MKIGFRSGSLENWTLGLLKFHVPIEDVLSHFISKKDLQNIRLKIRINELKGALSPKPLFTKTLSIVTLDQGHQHG